MNFELVPILDRMENLYKLPRTPKRFEEYLNMLQGGQNGDMILPIQGFNPMGKENVLLKIQALKEMKAENIIQKILTTINSQLNENENKKIEVVLNLVDDVGGAWSNIYTTDYSSKFEIDALMKRGFCVPYFWTSEDITETLLIHRTKEYLYRTLFWINSSRPKTLQDFFEQEIYVQINSNEIITDFDYNNYLEIEDFYIQNASSDEYNIIFNFFYGDEASKSLGYKTYGMKKYHGFDYAKYISKKRNSN